MFNHVMLEVHCSREWDDSDASEIAKCDGVPQYKCLENKCPYVVFTSYENCLCYVNENSVCEKSIAFDGEEFIQKKELLLLWKNISSKKIDEAYDEFMKKKMELDADTIIKT